MSLGNHRPARHTIYEIQLHESEAARELTPRRRPRVAVPKRCKHRKRHKRPCRRVAATATATVVPVRRLRLHPRLRLRRRTFGDLRPAGLSRAITLQAQVRDVTARAISNEYAREYSRWHPADSCATGDDDGDEGDDEKVIGRFRLGCNS